MQILQKQTIHGYTNFESNYNNTEIIILLLGLWTDMVTFNLGHAVSAPHPPSGESDTSLEHFQYE